MPRWEHEYIVSRNKITSVKATICVFFYTSFLLIFDTALRPTASKKLHSLANFTTTFINVLRQICHTLITFWSTYGVFVLSSVSDRNSNSVFLQDVQPGSRAHRRPYSSDAGRGLTLTDHLHLALRLRLRRKVEMSLSTPRRHSGQEVKLHPLSTSALDEGEWLTACPNRLAPQERTWYYSLH